MVSVLPDDTCTTQPISIPAAKRFPFSFDGQFLKTRIANGTYAVVNWLTFFISAFIPSKKTTEKKLLIIRADEIGDYILFRNSLEAIKTSSKFEGHKVILLANQAYADLARHLDSVWVDKFLFFDKHRFLFDPVYRLSFLIKLRRENYEIVLNTVYSRGIYLDDNFAHVCRAKSRIAWDGNNINSTTAQLTRSAIYYSAIVRSDLETANLFEFERNKHFLEILTGGKVKGTFPHVPKQEEAKEWFPKNRYVVLFHGASKESKRWSPESFAALAVHLHTKHGLIPVLAGAAGDIPVATKILATAGSEVILDYTGKTNLVELLALIYSAELTISNDTCAYHFAGAMGKKVLVICNGSSLGRFIGIAGHGYPDCLALYPVSAQTLGSGGASIHQVTVSQAQRAVRDLLKQKQRVSTRQQAAYLESA